MTTPTSDLSAITEPAVLAAVTAWQRADAAAWGAAFADGATLTDDGKPRDFAAFSAEIGNEYFTAIEAVSDDGHQVTGTFHSDTWGDFRTFFRFQAGADGRFTQLDIGQA